MGAQRLTRTCSPCAATLTRARKTPSSTSASSTRARWRARPARSPHRQWCDEYDGRAGERTHCRWRARCRDAPRGDSHIASSAGKEGEVNFPASGQQTAQKLTSRSPPTTLGIFMTNSLESSRPRRTSRLARRESSRCLWAARQHIHHRCDVGLVTDADPLCHDHCRT
eukprot:7377906-Prymnesium_polylepis.1